MGDINHDGIADIAIADPANGAVYVVFGNSNSNSSNGSVLNVASLDGSNGFKLADDSSKANSSSSSFGSSLTALGDINGDGFDDFALVGPASNNSQATVLVVLGNSSFAGVLNTSSLHEQGHGFSIEVSGVPSSASGSVTVVGAGDINGDGIADIAIGSPSTGSVAVVYGSANISQSDTLATDKLNGTTGYNIVGSVADGFGTSIAGGRDIDGDNKADLLISAPGADGSQGSTDNGKVYVFPGFKAS